MAEDLIGRKFGRLTVVERDGTRRYPYGGMKATWLCVCDCGNTIVTTGNALKRENTKSCGCLKLESTRVNGRNNLRHGDSFSRLYNIWHGMKNRCYCEKMQDYHNYGGRGIKVCDDWISSYEVFRDWALDNGYDDSKSIDRIDFNGNYEPNNCRWATLEEQSNNRCTNHYIEIDGEVKTLTQWARQYNMLPETLRYRMQKLNMEPKEALTTPPMRTARRKPKYTEEAITP